MTDPKGCRDAKGGKNRTDRSERNPAPVSPRQKKKDLRVTASDEKKMWKKKTKDEDRSVLGRETKHAEITRDGGRVASLM